MRYNLSMLAKWLGMTNDDRPWLERAELIAGEPCVNFINSVANRTGPDATEKLRAYADLLAWLQRCELLRADEAATLLCASRRRPDAARRTLDAALRFRDVAWRLLWATAHGDAPAVGDLTRLERHFKWFRNRTGLAARPECGFCRAWQGDADDLEQAMWRTATALEHFLVSDRLHRLRGCAGEHCGWLFVDDSRNGTRRWCSMRDCGNRAKARRHYRRTRAM